MVDWHNYCGEVCTDGIMNHRAGPIGGPGTTVKIDESKVGKMKYYHGRPVEGKWIFVAFAEKPRPASLFR